MSLKTVRTRTARRFAAGLAILVIAAAATALTGCSKPPVVDEPIRAVRTLTIGSEATGATLEYAAEVRPRIESRLGFRVGGKVIKRNVELGASVKAGQVLAQLDPKDLRLGQESARAALAAAQSNLDLSAADLKRYKDLKEQGFISAAELERRNATFLSAQSSFNQARSQLSVQGNQADYALLVSDTAGVVTGVDVEPGTVVAAGAPAIRVAQDGPRDVVFSVPEDKLGLMRALGSAPGALMVRPWGDAAQLIPARVREIAAAADPSTRTFLVKADIGTTSLTIGQTATVLFSLPQAEGLTRLPLGAVTQAQGKTSVWLLDGQAMSVRLQPIEVGGASGNTVVVLSGLKAGDEVVTAGVHVLTPGEKVKRYVEPYAATPPAESTLVGVRRAEAPAAVPAASPSPSSSPSASTPNVR